MNHAERNAKLRGDGSPWVHIHLTLSDDMSGIPLWPRREEAVPQMLYSYPDGDYYLGVWDLFKNGRFLRTRM